MKRKKKAEHKRELKKKEEKGKVDKKKAEAELNATLANLTLRAFDPPLRYPLIESDLQCINQIVAPDSLADLRR